jgi:hypothetical protein
MTKVLGKRSWFLHASVFGLSAVVCAAGCASENAGPEREERADDGAPALAQGAAGNAAATTQKEITIASLPDAKCTLTDDATGDSNMVLADDEGLVHVWAAPKAASRTLTLDCDEPDGSAGSRPARYNFDLAQARTFARARPRVQSTRRRILPGLADPTGISQNEVTEAGYPPRPDRDSPRYERWLELVSRPVTLIEPHGVQTDQFRGPATTGMPSVNFAGVALSAASTRYTDAASWMFVPEFILQGTKSIASPWVGLGGVHDRPIIQMGVQGTSTGGVATTYFGWLEYYINGLWQTDVNVHVDDYVYMEVYECDSVGHYGPSYHGYGCFYWWNYYTNFVYPWIGWKMPTQDKDGNPFPAFTGKTCEFVIERSHDQCSGGYCNLSKWNGIVGGTLDCFKKGGTTSYSHSTDPYELLSMINGSNQKLATPSANYTDQVGVDWLRAN